MITLRKVLNFYGYKTHKRRPKAVQEILDVLEYMINNKMIEVQQDLDTLGYDTGIEIKIIPENFDAADKFSKITSSQLDFIMMNESSINKENILMAFLYINSYIFIRPKIKIMKKLCITLKLNQKLLAKYRIYVKRIIYV